MALVGLRVMGDPNRIACHVPHMKRGRLGRRPLSFHSPDFESQKIANERAALLGSPLSRTKSRACCRPVQSARLLHRKSQPHHGRTGAARAGSGAPSNPARVRRAALDFLPPPPRSEAPHTQRHCGHDLANIGLAKRDVGKPAFNALRCGPQSRSPSRS
jgi:hypothetical protein